MSFVRAARPLTAGLLCTLLLLLVGESVRAPAQHGPAVPESGAASANPRAAQPIRRRAADDQTFVFMGGLQRSGTTWLEGLVASPLVSGLSLDNVDPRLYEQRRPWQLQNHTQAYFEMVVRSGGVEGKFVQQVYPYVYLVRDLGTGRAPLSGLLGREPLLIESRRVPPADAKRLYSQWSLFWDVSKPLLLEKTPENALMGPYLQAAFGPASTRFAFVMRHPLVWALAIEKWIFPEFVALRTVEDRVAFWFETMSHMVEQLPQLRDVIVMQLESISSSRELQLAVARHLLCNASSSSAAVRDQPVPSGIGESGAILSSSLAYVTCWLAGLEFKASLKRCVPRHNFRDPAYRTHPEMLGAENRWRLRQLAAQREAQANTFGYSFRPFLKLARLSAAAVQRERVGAGAPSAQAAQLGVGTSDLVRAALRPSLVSAAAAPSPPPPQPAPAAASRSGGGAHVLVLYHKMGGDREKPTGMDIRMTQVVQSLASLRLTVHFVCHCDVEPSQLSPFEGDVVIYPGSLQQQYEAAVGAAPIKAAFLFFTTLTMLVHQRMVQATADAANAQWHHEPAARLPEELVLSWLRRDRSRVCTVAVADDIHYIRVVEVMGRHDAAQARLASAWVRQRELSFHSAVDSTATVSLEDSATLQAALGSQGGKASAKRCAAGCVCGITWVPYVQQAVGESAVEPFERRHDGMLYVGGMHGLAVIAIEWLVSRVQPSIARSSARGDADLMLGGPGHLHLAGPGWAQHIAESRVLNASVAEGRVTILGTLSDLQLERRLAEHRVFVAPVLNGTGIATKNVLAMAKGIPLVTTPIGLNGLGLPEHQRAVLTADGPAEFARHVLSAQSSVEVFDATWRAALQHTRRFLSASRQREVVCGLIGCSLPHAPSTPTDGQADGRAPTLCPAKGAAAAAQLPTAGAAARGHAKAVVLLGLEGAGATELAAAIRSRSACIVQEPLRGLMRAPLSAQLEHLKSILTEPSYCGASAEGRGRLGSRTLVQGFALELPAAPTPSALLSSAGGLEALSRMLSATKASIVLVRRCSMLPWAAERLLPPPKACESGRPCVAPRSKLSATSILSTIAEGVERDGALQVYVDATTAAQPARRYRFLYEWMHDQSDAFPSELPAMQAFLGVAPQLNFSSRVADWSASVSNIEEVRAQLSALPAAQGRCGASFLRQEPTCSSAAGGCSLAQAVGGLTPRERARPPVIVVGAHDASGGGLLVGKLLGEACKAYLAPKLRLRCQSHDGFEGCDPEQADVCFLKKARFSAGRYADRGYRFVHVVREPLEVLTRSYLLLEPNATRALNASVLAASLESHLRELLGGALHEMQAIADTHASDPHALRIRVEELESASGANATLGRMFGFMLGNEASDGAVRALVAVASRVLPPAVKAEQHGENQRRHVGKLLLKKPAKCHHINKVQQALGYTATACTETKRSSAPTTERRALRRRRLLEARVARARAHAAAHLPLWRRAAAAAEGEAAR